MAAINASVEMQFIDDEIPEIFKQLHPFCMVRKNSRVKHVRVGKYDIRLLANGTTRILRCIAVVRMTCKTSTQSLIQPLQLKPLIFGQRLGGKEENRPLTPVPKNGVDDRKVVAKRFSASGRGNDNCISTCERVFHRCGLMNVQLFYATGGQRGTESRMEFVWKCRKFCRLGWFIPHCSYTGSILLHRFLKSGRKRVHG